MARPWTLDRLKGLSPLELDNLYRNAEANGSAEADGIIELILKHELLERVGRGLKRHHPTIQKIEAIVRSDKGVEAAIAAARAGQAPMAGVDALLQDGVGPNHGNDDTTSWAGTFVAEEMEAAGWLRDGRRQLPATCAAKTAAFFRERRAV